MVPAPSNNNLSDTPPVVIIEANDEEELLRQYGVCRVPIPTDIIDLTKWAHELSQVTPMIMAVEGDAQYAFYRNILDEPDFPFDAILQSNIGTCLSTFFCHNNNNKNYHDDDEYADISSQPPPFLALEEIIRLDDAFCVHYNTDQADTTGAKHTDPSDITVNMCLEKSSDAQGSQVLFYGTKRLLCHVDIDDDDDDVKTKVVKEVDHEDDQQQQHNNTTTTLLLSTDVCDDDKNNNNKAFSFLVDQIPGYATIHWGSHPHETLELKRGHRTNIVLTYCFEIHPAVMSNKERAILKRHNHHHDKHIIISIYVAAKYLIRNCS